MSLRQSLALNLAKGCIVILVEYDGTTIACDGLTAIEARLIAEACADLRYRAQAHRRHTAALHGGVLGLFHAEPVTPCLRNPTAQSPIGIDIGKNLFHVVGNDRRGAIVSTKAF